MDTFLPPSIDETMILKLPVETEASANESLIPKILEFVDKYVCLFILFINIWKHVMQQ